VPAAHDPLELLALSGFAENGDVVLTEAAIVFFHLLHEALVAVFRSAAAKDFANGFLLVLGEKLGNVGLGDGPVGAVLLAERIVEWLANDAFLLVVEAVIEAFDGGFRGGFGFLLGGRDLTQE